MYKNSETEAQLTHLIDTASYFHGRGWVPATSGNFSVRSTNDTQTIFITRSGIDKGYLKKQDFLAVDLVGKVLPTFELAAGHKPSDETILHCQIYKYFDKVKSVLHTHSLAATLLSKLSNKEFLRITDFEIIKALGANRSHQAVQKIPVFANSQDMLQLSNEIMSWLDRNPQENVCAYLIAGHGLYTWGKTLAEARRHVEALEFLFECLLTEYNLTNKLDC